MSAPPPQPISLPPAPVPSVITTHPILGIFGVLLGAMIQTGRLFGGEAGTAFILHFVAVREQFHSNILGLGVHLGEPAASQRLLGLSAAMAVKSTGPDRAMGRAAEILGLQVRQQASTLAISDRFTLVARSVGCCLIVAACMERVPTQYQQVVTAAKAA